VACDFLFAVRAVLQKELFLRRGVKTDMRLLTGMLVSNGVGEASQSQQITKLDEVRFGYVQLGVSVSFLTVAQSRAQAGAPDVGVSARLCKHGVHAPCRTISQTWRNAWFAQHMGLIQAIHNVPLRQKTYKHSPHTKILEFLVALLGGLPYLQDISRAAYPLDRIRRLRRPGSNPPGWTTPASAVR